VNDEYKGRFEVFVFGGRNTLFSWSQMAMVAPLEGIEGDVDRLVLEAGIGGNGGGGNETTPPPSNGAVRIGGRAGWSILMAVFTVVVFAL
jgi:hexosaminidase